MGPFVRKYGLPITVGVVLTVIVFIWGHNEQAHTRTVARKELGKNAQVAMDVLRGALQSEVRRGRVSRGRFVEVLESIRTSTGLMFVKVEIDGKTLIALPQDHQLEFKTDSDSSGLLTKDSFYYWRTEEIQNCAPCRGQGGGRQGRHGNSGRLTEPDDVNLINTKQKIIIGFNRTEYDRSLAAAIQRIYYIESVCVFAILAFMVAWVLNMKSRSLQLELKEISARAGQLEELNLVATGLAHETKNPLGIIRGMAQRIAEMPEDVDKVHDMAQKIIDETEITSERLGEFMQYARNREPDMQTIELQAFMQGILVVFEDDFRELNIVLAQQVQPVSVEADKDMLTQIITNLILNSIDAMPDGGTLTLCSHVTGRNVELSVKDTGTGIPAEILPNVFKPYVSGKTNGHGIGLSVVKRIIEACGWDIYIESQQDAGTEIRIAGIEQA